MRNEDFVRKNGAENNFALNGNAVVLFFAKAANALTSRPLEDDLGSCSWHELGRLFTSVRAHVRSFVGRESPIGDPNVLPWNAIVRALAADIMHQWRRSVATTVRKQGYAVLSLEYFVRSWRRGERHGIAIATCHAA